MGNELLYLRPNVVIEPLIERWYAWSHIISPATAAMNVTKRHMEIMNSYIESPELHATAAKDPKMLGGPFVDYNRNRVPEIKKLLEDTIAHQADLIDLSMAIRRLDKLLIKEARGYSLEKVYENIPEQLQGYVELFYDLHNNPSYRLYESLLYNSKYYNKKTQSIALWITNNDSRPFCLSTPALNEDNILFLDIHFDSYIIDELAKMKRVPKTYSDIKSIVGEVQNENLFNSFLYIS